MIEMMANMAREEEDVVYEFSTPQRETSTQMFTNFDGETTRHNILLAQMQSGKTGTAKYIVYNLSSPKHGRDGKLELDAAKFYFMALIVKLKEDG
jgi:hypothetical protein